MISAAEFLKWCAVFKITGGGGGGGVTSTQVQQQAFNTSADTGTANTYVGTISPVPTTLTQSLPVLLTVANTNTGAATFNLNALGSHPIVNLDGSALAGGELDAGSNAFLLYSTTNTNWVLLNSALSGGVFNFATKAQVQQSSYNVGVDSGIADAYVVALTPPSVSLTDGLSVEFAPLHTNLTATPTVNVDGHGVKDILLINGDPLLTADMPSALNRTMLYDSSTDVFYLQNPALSYTTARDVQENNFISGLDGGSLNTYDISITPAPPATIPEAFPVWIRNIQNTNTGASTFALNGGSALAIVNLAGTALTGGELVLHNDAYLVYNITNNNWVLQNSALAGSGGGVTAAQVQSSAFNVGIDSGTANLYVVALTPPSSSLSDGMIVYFQPLQTNTIINPTVDVDGHGAIEIVLAGEENVNIADISESTSGVFIQYNEIGDNFILLNPCASYVFVGSLSQYTYAVDTGTTNAYDGTSYLNLNNTSPIDGQYVSLGNMSANTGAATLTVNDLSPIAIWDNKTLAPLVGGEIPAGSTAEFQYNSVNDKWLLLNSALGVPGGYATIDAVQYQAYNYSQDTGAVNSYVAALNPTLFAGLANGLPVSIDITNGNTGAATLNVDGTGALPILNLQGNPLVGGEMIGGFVYDFKSSGGANWILQNSSLASGGGVTAAQVQSEAFNTCGTDTGAADMYVTTLTPTLSAYPAYLPFQLIPANTNLTTTPTINIDGIGALVIVLPNELPVFPGDIVATLPMYGIINQTRNECILLNPQASSANVFSIQSNAYNYGNDSGATNAVAVTLSPALSTFDLNSSFSVYVNIGHTNTGASTLDAGLGALAILTPDGNALNGGELVANNVAFFLYNVPLNNYTLMNSASVVSGSTVQKFSFNHAIDSGAVNALVGVFIPAIAAPPPNGFIVGIDILSDTNTGAATLDAGWGAIAITATDFSALIGGEMIGGHSYYFGYDYDYNTWTLLNSSVSVTPFSIQSQQYTTNADTGTSTAYVVDLTPVPTSINYPGQFKVGFLAANTNTITTPTLNVNSNGAIPIEKSGGAALLVGSIVGGYYYECVLLPGPGWQILNPTI